jgi:hypothetical protein
LGTDEDLVEEDRVEAVFGFEELLLVLFVDDDRVYE